MQRTTRRDGLEILGSWPKQVSKFRLELVVDWYDFAELVDVLLPRLFDQTNANLLVRPRAQDTYILLRRSQSHPSLSLTTFRTSFLL